MYHLARPSLVVAGAMLCLMALPACSPKLDWRQMQIQSLQASFPCQAKPVTREVSLSSAAQAIEMQVWSCQADEATWAVSVVPLALVTEVVPTLQALPQIMRSNLQAASQAAGISDGVQAHALGPVQVPGMTPQAQSVKWQFDAKRTDAWGRPMTMRITAWHFSHGLNVYQVTVSRPLRAGNESYGQDVELPFWEGLQFLP